MDKEEALIYFRGLSLEYIINNRNNKRKDTGSTEVKIFSTNNGSIVKKLPINRQK